MNGHDIKLWLGIITLGPLNILWIFGSLSRNLCGITVCVVCTYTKLTIFFSRDIAML